MDNFQGNISLYQGSIIVIGSCICYRTSLLVMTSDWRVTASTLPKIYSADTTVFIERNIIDNLVSGIAVSPSIDDQYKSSTLCAC